VTKVDETLTAGEADIEAQLRAIAGLVEAMPPCATATSVRGRRPTRRALPAVRRAPLASKAAVLLFVAMVAAVGIVVGVSRPSATMHSGLPRGVTPAPASPLPGTTAGPCAGQPPGCGSALSTAAVLSEGQWSTFPAGPLAERTGQVEVWTGHELIVWGGEVDLQSLGDPVYTADGAAYDPATRTWQMLPPAPLSPREDAAAAWTGSEMIVVGGVSGLNGTVGHDDAASYDPSTNTWTLLPLFPLEARSGAPATWTGRQLIVFGGQAASDAPDRGLADGAVYMPADNSWSVLPAVPAQAGWTVGAVAPAWTGSELIAWVTWQKSGPCGQGCGYVDERQLGFALRAGASSWTALGVPKVQTGGAATAWTGSEVLAVGGTYCPRSCPPPIGQFGTYQPATSSWAIVPGYASRGGSLALWTGRAFVAAYGNGLGAYDFTTRRWWQLPAVPAGVASAEAAVWTGRQLLVWGTTPEELTAG
jgi:hypothetical protein